ncbi:hypothetical protein OAT16_00915 [Prolixibacteraceae bacterium]|nr:hypothetical protein [Prolixibacteraceae bacterium]
MSLKDKGGLSKMIAMVSVKDYTIVGVGSSIKEASRSYKNTLHQLSGNFTPDQFENQIEVPGTILRFGQDVRNGNSSYYIQLKEYPEIIFVGSSSISNEFTISHVGDSVSLRIDDLSSSLIDVISFDNKDITQRQKVEKSLFITK